MEYEALRVKIGVQYLGSVYNKTRCVVGKKGAPKMRTEGFEIGH